MRLSAMSLATVTCAAPDLLGSAWLVARISTPAVPGRSTGAVYSPVAVIVPKAAFPPGTPLTVQVTPVSGVPLTLAEKLSALPSNTELFCGVTLTVMGGGGGGGGGATGPTPPPPQPRVSALAVRRPVQLARRITIARFLERVRTLSAKQAKGQRKSQGVSRKRSFAKTFLFFP